LTETSTLVLRFLFRRPGTQSAALRRQVLIRTKDILSPSRRTIFGVLRGEGDSATRALICSLRALEWPYRRLICANCGEEDKVKLPVYVAAKDGFAVPEVDEIATVALNLWAEEHGYTKIETNVLGM
jgi:formate dehydrogenase maturation protein FdhE